MKRLINTLFALAVFSIAYAPTAIAQDMNLNEILNNYFETVNQEKLNKVKTITATGKVVLQGGALELPFTMKQKRENMVRMDAEMQGQKATFMAYDGENGWMLTPWTGSTEPQDLPSEQLKNAKEAAEMDDDLYKWKEKGHKVELVGTADVEGTETYEIKLTKENGDVDHYFMDADNFVPLKITSKRTVQGAEVEGSQYLSNYKPVNGIIMPHNMENRSNGQTVMQLIIEEVKLDEEIPDSYFKKPETQ